jgi:hypothetical protein
MDNILENSIGRVVGVECEECRKSSEKFPGFHGSVGEEVVLF